MTPFSSLVDAIMSLFFESFVKSFPSAGPGSLDVLVLVLEVARRALVSQNLLNKCSLPLLFEHSRA